MKDFTLQRRPGATRSRSRARWAALLPVFAVGLMIPLWLTASALSAATVVDLGAAESFGALSSTAMTNAGADTVVGGDIGSSTSIDAGVTNPGFDRYGASDTELTDAQASLLTAYGAAEAQAPDFDITGSNLAGQTLVPGVYNSTGGILIDGPVALTLDGGGDPNAVFVFQAASAGDLIVAATSSLTYTNGAQPCNVFWKVNSAFLRNTGGTFIGTILALTQITLTDDIDVEGRLLARNADVTFINDTVTVPTCAVTQTTTTDTTTTDTTTTDTTTTDTTTTDTTTTETTTTDTTTTDTTTTDTTTTDTTTTDTTTTDTTTTPETSTTTSTPETAPAVAPAPAPVATPTRSAPAAKSAAAAKRAAATKAAARREATRVAGKGSASARGHARLARVHTGFTG